MKKNCFAQRRDALTQKMNEKEIAIFPAAQEMERHLYRQDSDFYYLTGFEEAESIAVLYKDHLGTQFILLNRPEDVETALWTGNLVGQAGACLEYGATHSYPIHQAEEVLLKLCEGKERIYYPIGRYAQFDHMMMQLFKKMQAKQRRSGVYPKGWTSSNVLTHDLRLIKDEEEIKCLRQSAQIAANAHTKAMEHCRPGMYEYELKACLISEFIRQGAMEEAYPSIVAGGVNGCILHYFQNQDVLKAGELVLVDAGATFKYYSSDITRTFPIDTHFTKAQASIYQLVLEAQLAVIEAIKPGIHFIELHNMAATVLTSGLIDLGILKGSLKQCLEDKAYSAFFMHGISHWIGICLHDVGSYQVEGGSRILEPGMVLTVEPGLYLSETRANLLPKWRNIAVRIEDDVLVTETGCEVLSKDAPKTIHEIEALRV